MSELNFRQASRQDWINTASGNPSREQIATGALQRIADATETMAKSYDIIRDDRDRWLARAIEAEASLRREKRAHAKTKRELKRVTAP